MNKRNFRIAVSDDSIIHLKAKDHRLGKVIDAIGELKCYIHNDGYEFIICEIVGQMLSKKVTDIITARLVELCDGKISPRRITGLKLSDLRNIGLSNAKSQYILNFNNAVQSKECILNELKLLSDEEVMKKLMKIKGIGSWTAKMYLLFVLCRQDVLPYEDGAFLQSYKWLYETSDITRASIMARCKCWRPYSSVASRYLYHALDMGLTKTPILSLMNDK